MTRFRSARAKRVLKKNEISQRAFETCLKKKSFQTELDGGNVPFQCVKSLSIRVFLIIGHCSMIKNGSNWGRLAH